MHEKRGIQNSNHIPRDHTKRSRNSFQVPLQIRRGFAAVDPSRTTEAGHPHPANGAAAPVLIFEWP